MKILNIPAFTWESGIVQIRQCRIKGCTRAHVNPYPQTRDVLFDEVAGGGDPVAVYIRDCESRSGLSYSHPEPSIGLPVCRGYGDHGVLVVAQRVHVLPIELAGARVIATIRAEFQGAKTVYAVEADTVQPGEVLPTLEESACPACRVAAAETADPVARQGNLRVLRPQDVPGAEDWSFPAVRQFFNHGVEEHYPIRARGRFAYVDVGLDGATLTSPDHPDEVITLPEGRWILYHPWPRRGWVD